MLSQDHRFLLQGIHRWKKSRTYTKELKLLITQMREQEVILNCSVLKERR
jgi:hypothetical protein